MSLNRFAASTALAILLVATPAHAWSWDQSSSGFLNSIAQVLSSISVSLTKTPFESSLQNTAQSVTLNDALSSALKSLKDLLSKQSVVTSTVPARGKNTATGQILVSFKAGVNEDTKAKLITRWGLADKGSISGINVRKIKVPVGMEDDIVAGISQDPSVKYAEVDAQVYPSLTPNDPLFASEWHDTTMNTPTAWDTTTGTGVLVADVDSGVDPTHPDLAAHLRTDLGWNFVDNNSNTADIYGHGTQTAGTMAAIGNNANQVAGVAYNAGIIPIRVALSDGSAYISTIAQGITYAADHGAKVANASFGYICDNATIENAANYMSQKGGVTTIAAGNYANTTGSATANTDVMCVSATGNTNTLASWSNYGNAIDLSAPGVGIYSTTMGGGAAAVSGTSFSAPNVAGVAALVYAANPSLSASQVRQILINSATDLGATGWDQYYGWGLVDAAKAVALAKNTTSTTPLADTIAPSVSISSPSTGTTVSGTVQFAVSSTDNVGVSKVELWKDGALYATDTTSPYGFSWSTTVSNNGTHTFIAKSYDAAGNVGTSSTVTLSVNNVSDTTAPSVTITSPANGSVLPTHGNATVTVAATDNVGVATIYILFDSTVRATCSSASTCSASINLNKVSKGTHTITANAYDSAGNKGTTSITVTK